MEAEHTARDPELEDDENGPPPWADVLGGQLLTLLPTRRPELPEDNHPPPSVDVYDQILNRRPKDSA
ncbi:hypothetical protein ACWDSD_41130 [Streptomyces spiralis]